MAKYFYKGKLVKTSKRDTYRYGLYDPKNDLIMSCSSTQQGALKEKTSQVNFFAKEVEWGIKHNDEFLEENEEALKRWQEMYVVELEREV